MPAALLCASLWRRLPEGDSSSDGELQAQSSKTCPDRGEFGRLQKVSDSFDSILSRMTLTFVMKSDWRRCWRRRLLLDGHIDAPKCPMYHLKRYTLEGKIAPDAVAACFVNLASGAATQACSDALMDSNPALHGSGSAG
ncbi:unnamed protein product [Durusdinium trenchii]|uniref:Uncharacterized protein n=1 Tax=Durusdinium trenchii TaxID=1381693 RepID=A0ABP0LWC4_9DINO